MKRFILSTLCFFILLTNSQGQWAQTDGPYGQAYTFDLEKVNSTLFATTYKGVFSKKDGDQQWQRHTVEGGQFLSRSGDSILSSNYRNLAILETNSSGVSTHMHSRNSNVFSSSPLMVYKDSTLLVASSMGVYISHNLGKTFGFFNTGLDMDTIHGAGNPFYILRVSEIICTDNYIYCATTKGVYRSDFSFTQWERKNNKNTRQIYKGQNALYAVSGDTLYKSTDHGDNWTSIFDQTPFSVCEHNGDIYINSKQGILSSSNNGLNWNLKNSGLSSSLIRKVKSLEGSLYCFSVYGDIFKWNGNQWIPETGNGLINTWMRGIETTDSAVFAADVETGIYKYNHDNTWANVSPTYSNKIISFEDLRIYNDTIYSLIGVNDTATNQRYLDVCYSWDDGQNWTCVTGPVLNTTSTPLSYGLFKIFNGTFYFFDGSFVLRTQNLNSPWEDISPLYTFNCPGIIHDLSYFDGKVYISGCDKGSLRYYDESQQTWIQEPITFLVGQEADLISIRDTFLFAHSSNGVYRRSTSNNFYTKVGSLDTMEMYASDYINIGKSLYVTAHTGLYRSTDHGLTWSSLNTGLPDNWGTVDVGAYNDTLFLALYDYGVFKHPLLQDPISINEVNAGNQDVSIFPNPAKDWVTVTLTQGETDASFSISDQTGKLLLFGELDESGKINTSSLAKGNYVLSLQTSSGIKTTKLIIAK